MTTMTQNVTQNLPTTLENTTELSENSTDVRNSGSVRDALSRSPSQDTVPPEEDSHNHWFTRGDVEHFLGNPDVVHVILLVFGVVIIVVGDRFPKLISVVAAVTFGIWCGLMIQERQDAGKTLGGILPPSWEQSPTLPGIAAFVAAGAAGALVHFAQKAALVLLTGGVFMLVCGSILRMANINPTEFYNQEKEQFNAHSLVAICSFVIGVVSCCYLVNKFSQIMLLVCGALIGTLLMISGISYFAQRGEEPARKPVSLLDDLANTYADVRSGKCELFGSQKGGCDCGEECKAEIVAWFVVSALVLLFRYALVQCNKRRKYKLMEDEDEVGKRNLVRGDVIGKSAKLR